MKSSALISSDIRILPGPSSPRPFLGCCTQSLENLGSQMFPETILWFSLEWAVLTVGNFSLILLAGMATGVVVGEWKSGSRKALLTSGSEGQAFSDQHPRLRVPHCQTRAPMTCVLGSPCPVSWPRELGMDFWRQRLCSFPATWLWCAWELAMLVARQATE